MPKKCEVKCVLSDDVKKRLVDPAPGGFLDFLAEMLAAVRLKELREAPDEDAADTTRADND